MEATDGAGRRHTYEADVLVQATGRLHSPHVPEFKDSDKFAGKVFHSSRWDPLALSESSPGTRVAVVGTGASAVQIVPNVADQVNKLYVVQRKPAWVANR